MEKADRNLLDYMKSNEKPEYEEYAPQFRGLCEALAVLHQFAIHRDIKPENILIKGETWVLSDFGLCSFLSPEDHQDITKLNEKVGPMFWMSPEAIDCYYFGGKEIGKYSDVFQICLVFVFVLTHKYPGGIFSAENIDTTPLIKELILEAMLLEMDDEDDNPFGEDIEPEDDLDDDDEFFDEDAESENKDEYEFDDIDPEIFRDPLLMVKWLNRHTQNQS